MTVSPPRDTYEGSTKEAVFSGVSMFAGVMLIVLGGFQVLEAISALAKDAVFVRGVNYTYELDVTAWGWIHLILGLLAVAVGIGVLTGNPWGRTAGIVIAFFSAVSNFAFMPYYPLWTLLAIAIAVLVIWALCTQLAHDRS